MTLSLAAIDIADQGVVAATPIDLTELTTMSLTGTGVFDVLMQSMKLHLKDEYDSHRITGKEYAQVCSSMMAAVMQQSVAFLLQQQQILKTQADIALVRQQTVTELAQTDDDIPAGLGFNNSTLIEGIVGQQRIALEKTIEKTNADIDMVNQQTVTELAQTDEYIPAGLGKNTGTTVDGVIALNKTLVEAQIAASLKGAEKIDADVILTLQQSMTELAQTSDSVVLGVGLNPVAAVTGMMKVQKDMTASQVSLNNAQIVSQGIQDTKTQSEISLLKQKTITELAQTDDHIIEGFGLNNTTVVEGAIKKQNDLYTAQTAGFARDAEQKAAKAMLDIWSVQRTTDEGMPVPASVANTSIDTVVNKMKVGIGL
jgi:hypothetical protein